ncbi:hypothetical protein ANN_04210 [Periplaneta americana]|uniref:DUF4817 domain-containing protein n=1 Tax=Periplaneta americana TaxID=6978 RepID=A0ABQ8T9F8_PERAM|nr:hypothetical protein ANN_04210 [Periplaneta americana]
MVEERRGEERRGEERRGEERRGEERRGEERRGEERRGEERRGEERRKYVEKILFACLWRLAKQAASDVDLQICYDKVAMSEVRNQLAFISKGKWESEWSTTSKATLTKALFPSVQDKLKLKIEITPNLTTLLTGHGRLDGYFHRFKIKNSATCVSTQRAYQREFGVRNPLGFINNGNAIPKRNTILGLVNKLETTGSLVSEKSKHRSSRLPTVVVDEPVATDVSGFDNAGQRLLQREEQRLRVFENKILRKICEAKREEVRGERRKLHNAELHALYPSSDIIRNIKSRRLRWAGHVTRMGESRNAYSVLVGRPRGKRPLGRPRHRWEDNIKLDLREVGYDDRDWTNLAQDRDRWRAYVRAAVYFPVP